MNPNRSMPERVKAAIRWTTLPTVTSQCVSTIVLDLTPHITRDVETLLAKHKLLELEEADATALPANIVDAILKVTLILVFFFSFSSSSTRDLHAATIHSLLWQVSSPPSSSTLPALALLSLSRSIASHT